MDVLSALYFGETSDLYKKLVVAEQKVDQLIVDAGQHGFLNGGHAHADALAITLSVRSHPLLIDPGTGCYTIDPAVRDRFRSTVMHNTMTVDGRPQSTPDGPFHWRTEAHGRAHEWRAGDDCDFFEGSHDGYAPLVHHRAVLSRPGCWFVIDRLLGEGTHRAELHWHFAPEWRVTRAGPSVLRAARRRRPLRRRRRPRRLPPRHLLRIEPRPIRASTAGS